MTQITEDYCNKEISVLLKEKGFDVSVKNYFSLNKDDMLHNLDKKYGAKKNWNAFEICISRPSQSLALKWLREVHGFIVTIDYDRYPVDNGENDVVGYGYNIQTKDNPEDYYRISEYVYDCYEEATEAALLYVLKNLI